MLHLVHHALEASPETLSPFVEHLSAIADGSDLRVACPYLGLAVLEPILNRARSWRLLTDAEALVKSLVGAQRAEIVRFLVEHGERVRHWPDLHAKVVVGDSRALVGSANLTAMGLGRRQEMAVAFEDCGEVEQLRGWFDALWQRCAAPSPEELEAFRASLPEEPPAQSTARIFSPAPRISATVIAPLAPAEDTGEEHVVERVARSPSREWSEGFFGLCAEVLETLRSEGDDPRVAMTLPKNERDVLRVNVNGREVLSAHRRDSRSIGLILPVGVELPPDLEERIVWSYDFRPASDERWFAYFAVDDPGQLAPLREAWLSAVGDEGGRGVRSRYRRFHVVAFHRAVREAEYRRRLLDAAFSTQA